MGKAKVVKKLAGALKKKLFTANGIRASLIAGGATVGAVSGLSRSEPGLRKAGAKEGLIGGAALGGVLAFSPQLARFAGRTAKSEAKSAGRSVRKGARKSARKIKGFFRRGGRVIPIFKKG